MATRRVDIVNIFYEVYHVIDIFDGRMFFVRSSQYNVVSVLTV